MENLLRRTWQAPQMLNGTNGTNGAVGLFSDQPAFEAGLADDGHAFIAFRQPDPNGRMGVYVVEGRPGGAGQPAAWSAPQLLDAEVPLLPGNFRPRVAVSATGHAVISWLTQRPCEADAVYESNPAGKTCRYFYASRRLASESTWEAPKRVRASPTMTSQDHFTRINAQGDVVLPFPSFHPILLSSTSNSTTLALRLAAEADYRSVGLSGFWSNSIDTTPFGTRTRLHKVGQYRPGRVAQAASTLRRAGVVHMDETQYPREGTSGNWVWAVVTPKVVSFNILPSRARYVAQNLIGTSPQAVVVSDRYAVYDYIQVDKRQARSWKNASLEKY